MGSGLILLVIVAAWLAVLVPMALRSHESSTSLASVDRFSDAMRVLSRRDAAARARARLEAEDDPLSAQAWAENDQDWDDLDDGFDADDVQGPTWRERFAGWRGAVQARVPALPGPSVAARARPPLTPARRRLRLLVALVALTLLALVGGLAGPRGLLVVAAVPGVACLLFVVQLRRLAVARAVQTGRAARPAAARPTRPVASPAPTPTPIPTPTSTPTSTPAAPRPAAPPGSVRVRPDDVPVEAVFDRTADEEPAVEAVGGPVPAPAAALGAAWSPVPIPPPTYVTAAVAPPRARRVVDLTRPGAWSQQEAREAAERAAQELPGTAAPAAPAAERRRAVNEW